MNEPETIIRVGEAGVKTVAVTIKAMQIGRKQMTQSVFRQLKREAIFDADTLRLRGEPWGTVNYFWEGCGGAGSQHLHLVWQKGAELRRSCVHDGCGEYQFLAGEADGQVTKKLEYYHRQSDIIAEVAVLRAILGGKEPLCKKDAFGRIQVEVNDWMAVVDCRVADAIRVLSEPSPDEVPPTTSMNRREQDWLDRHPADRFRADQVKRAKDQLDEHAKAVSAKLGSDMPPEMLRALFQQMQGERSRLKEEWAKFLEEVRGLDQLFIAV